MSKKEGESFRTMALARKKRRRRKNCQRITDSGIVSRSPSPPWWWSSASLTCHLSSRHPRHRTCMESSWRWATTTSTAVLADDRKQILFHPRASSSTQVVLADRPLPSRGTHYWEIYVPAVYGTSVMFGIASKISKASTNCITNNRILPSSE